MTGPEQDEYLTGLNAQAEADMAAQAAQDAAEAMEFVGLESTIISAQGELIQAMARTLEDCRTRIVGYDFDTAALQARIGELLARAEKCK